MEELKKEIKDLRQDSQKDESEAASFNQRSTCFKTFSPRSVSPKALSSNNVFSFESNLNDPTLRGKEDT